MAKRAATQGLTAVGRKKALLPQRIRAKYWGTKPWGTLRPPRMQPAGGRSWRGVLNRGWQGEGPMSDEKYLRGGWGVGG